MPNGILECFNQKTRLKDDLDTQKNMAQNHDTTFNFFYEKSFVPLSII